MLALAGLVPHPAVAQFQTISTDHFYIHFMSGASGTARRVAETAEEVFAPMAAAYNYYEDYAPIHIIVLDTSDRLGNGSADYSTNTIIIWATNLDIELRGSHDWIKNVLTHELAHIMTLNKARKKWPFQFALLQVTRFDANPDISFNFPLYHMNVPGWWTEGIAQYTPHQYGYDRWDSHRDMLLRMATLEDDLLSYGEMGSLGSRNGAYYGEMVYNQGYALLLYIQDQYGGEKVKALTHHSGNISFDPAIRQVLGISAGQLYDDWVAFLREHYGQLADEVRSQGLFQGRDLRELNEGIIEYYPTYSPDGKKLAYITSEKHDYAIPYLKIYDFETGEKKKLKDFVDTRISWSSDSQEIIYVRNKSNFNDLYIYNFEKDKETRISARLRAKDPAFSPDGERIVFVRNEDGANNLGLINRDGSDLLYLTNQNDGTQYSAPRFSPDGQWILFSVFRGEDRDIALMRADSPSLPPKYGRHNYPKGKDGSLEQFKSNAETQQAFPDSLAFPDPDISGFRALLASRADERDPFWLGDGSGFVFASDQSGIFNIYLYHLETGEVEQLTNVLGGAFAPSVSPSGRVAYSGYHAADYSLYEFELGTYQKTALVEPVALRDYQSIFRGPKLSEQYRVFRYSGRKTIDYIPILSVGPTFLGNEFGLNQLSAGLQFSTGEQFGGERLTAWGVFGKNFRADTDLNTDLGLYYERNLRPQLANNQVFNPSFYISLRRREIDSLQERQIFRADTLASTTIAVPVGEDSTVIYPNVKQYSLAKRDLEDAFKDVYKNIALGIDLPLTRRQRLAFQYMRRNYEESWGRQLDRVRFNDFFLQEVSPGDTVNITANLPAGVTAMDTMLVGPEKPLRFYNELEFYAAHELSLFWSYRKLNPTSDSRINPTGRNLVFLYRYMMPTVTDSLADLSLTVPDGLPRDQFGPAKRRLRVNEYIGAYQERIGLPFKNTLSFEILGAYRNLRVKNYTGDGGLFEGAFYWPLRYTLGGPNFLSGYPYFTRRGSKVLYGRLGYTFPLIQRLRISFLNFHFVNLYAELFAEAGAMGNFAKANFKPFSKKHILFEDFTSKDFLSDVGAELRMRLFTFYRIPMGIFFQVAHPLNRNRELEPRLRAWEESQAGLPPEQRSDEGRPEKIDKFRFYFGLGF